MADPVVIDGETLTATDVYRVAHEGAPVRLGATARTAIERARDRVETVAASDEAVYGVNTGFGRLVDERIDREDLHQLQRNLLLSHAAGVDDPLSDAVVRAMVVTRANALAKGFSGVRPAVVEALIALVNAEVHPVIPRRGSLGASGDLAPLAHLAIVLLGEGEAVVDGEVVDGETALAAADIEPLSLRAKEGLALINGTQLTLAIAALLVVDTRRVLDAADTAGALTTEVTYSTTASSDPGLAAVRPHPGHAATARNVRRLTEGSTVVTRHESCDRVQDVYSVRCLPQVHGAVRTALAHLETVVERELNAATDNPLVFASEAVDDRAPGVGDAAVLSGGNFHGEPLALPISYLQGALAKLATISERRADLVLNPLVQEDHLPAFLAEDPGLESGYMIAQYTAAALGTQARSRGRPALDNVTVSGNQEDHVSMSGEAALVAMETLEAARRVVATELLCGVEASRYLDDDLEHGQGTAAAIDALRERVPPLTEDRVIATDMADAADLIASGELQTTVEAAIDGPLDTEIDPDDPDTYR